VANAIMVIFPYAYQGTWVFDDEHVGLVKEPFVAGMPEMIDIFVQNIPNADKGFKLFFSSSPFPNYQAKIAWRREEWEGNWYYWAEQDLEGWLCPALFKYFDHAPKFLYLRAEAG